MSFLDFITQYIIPKGSNQSWTNTIVIQMDKIFPCCLCIPEDKYDEFLMKSSGW